MDGYSRESRRSGGAREEWSLAFWGFAPFWMTIYVGQVELAGRSFEATRHYSRYAIILHQGSLTRPNNHINWDQGIVAQRRGFKNHNEDESGAEQRPIKVADPSKWFAESFKAQL